MIWSDLKINEVKKWTRRSHEYFFVKVRLQGKDFFVKAVLGREEVMNMTGTEGKETLKDEDEGFKRLGMRFWSPFIYWTVKSYFDNQVLSRRRCLFGRALFFNSRIFGKKELSNLTRKLWPIR